jgi:hypothetical protein
LVSDGRFAIMESFPSMIELMVIIISYRHYLTF